MTTSTMIPSTLPESIVDELNQLGSEAAEFNAEREDSGEAFTRICDRMQLFLNSVRNVIQSDPTPESQTEVAMSTDKKELVGVVSGTFAFLISDGERVEVVLEDLQEVRRCIQSVLDAQEADRLRGTSAGELPRERAKDIEHQVEKRINSIIAIRPITDSVKSLREEAA
jgi:hypothetical protein